MKQYSGQLVQATPLIEGKVNVSNGIRKVNTIIHCVVDGSVLVKWDTGTTETIDMLAGNRYAFEGLVTIISGKFHLA